MATLANIRELRYDAVFRNKIEASILKQIVGIFIESAGTTNHAARLTWAKATILNTAPIVEQFAALLCAHPTIQDSGANTTDANMDTGVGAVVAVLVG